MTISHRNLAVDSPRSAHPSQPSEHTRSRGHRRLRRAAAWLTAVSLGASLAACSALTSEAPASATASSGTALAVSASFYPIEYLVEQIGGAHVSVTSVTPTNVEPHDFELSPNDVTGLTRASLLAYVSGFQPSLDDAVAEVSGPTVLDLADAVDLQDLGGTREAQDGTASTDPHFWLDPIRMTSAATAIEAALAHADPDHAADYEAGLARLTSTLSGLDTSFSTGLKQCERSTVVTSHAAFGYLTERYGLTQASISGIDPESEPSPADLAAIKKVVQDTGTTTVFTEELVSPTTAEALASETGARTAVLNPIESAPAEGDYADAMMTNLNELRGALGCE